MSSRHLIMGTSGHVDHGKTALIRLLTGVDTDRLKEERERGISIELGFAHLDLPSGVRLGIVDVPGHERFVKHMLAGAAGIDFVLLVVAADEGVMPQTVEHGQILELLGVERGAVAMTKIDMVDPELLELAEDDVLEYLAATPFGGWPLVRVSSATGEGRDAVLAALASVAAEVPERASDGHPRLPIDRSFVMAGFGTVVTGTLWTGSVSEGDQLVIQPGAHRARVRQVQSHGQRVKTGTAGSRLALALHGVTRAEAARGRWVVAPDRLQPTSILDVRLEAVRTGSRPIKQRERLRFHLGASEVYGRVTLFEGDELAPGQGMVAQLRLEEPVVALPGDRFVVRWYSPIRTAGGGHVIDAQARKRRRSDRAAASELVVIDSGSPAERVLAAVRADPPGGHRAGEIAERLGEAAARVAELLAGLAGEERVAVLGANLWVDRGWLDEVATTVVETVEDYQARFPLRYGIQLGELRSRFGRRLAAETVEAVLRWLVDSGRLHVQGDRARTGGEALELPAAARGAADRFKQALEEAGYTVPVSKTLLPVLGAGGDAQELLVYLTGAGEIVRLTDDLCYTREQLARLETTIADHFKACASLSVPEFKELVGVSRKYAVPLLEYLDDHGLTRRDGDNRVPGRRLAAPAAGRS